MDKIELSFEFVEKYVRFANPQYIQVYLYTKYLLNHNDEMPNAETVAGGLCLPADRIKFIFGYWVSLGEMRQIDEDTYEFTEKDKSDKNPSARPTKRKRSNAKMRPSYKSSEIDSAADKNQVLSGMFYQAESILGHMLSGNEIELLYSFYDWLGLPCEVIVMLLSYAAKQGKVGKRYLETVAIDWADKGIDTFDKAEEYITQLEEIGSNEHKIRTILGIYDRALTQTEKKYISAWTEELNISPELVSLAYDKTVENTGKLSFAYMNKILVSWHGEGIKDADGVKRSEEIYGKTKGQKSKKAEQNSNVQKSKFNNYNDTTKTDYDALEEKLLDMMLDN